MLFSSMMFQANTPVKKGSSLNSDNMKLNQTWANVKHIKML